MKKNEDWGRKILDIEFINGRKLIKKEKDIFCNKRKI
jgi:hypothetical protein